MTGPDCLITTRASGDGDDPRLDVAAFHRNREPIREAVARALGDRTGDVLEIGSGSGQHVVALAGAFPDIVWWPSDREPRHLASVEAWRGDAGLGNVRPAVLVDAAADVWEAGPGETGPGAGDGGEAREDLAGLLVINVLHIAPFAVTDGILRGAGRRLRPGGRLMVYGPFLRDGHFTTEGNRRFDRGLRAQNPAWGLRDIGAVTVLAQSRGLALVEVLPMPADNFFLIFEKPEAA